MTAPWADPGHDVLADLRSWMDVDLAPWQEAYFQAVLRGDRLVMTWPRRGGRSAFQDQVTKAYERPRGTGRPPIVIIDEIQHWSPGPKVDPLLSLCLDGLTPRSAGASPPLQGCTLEV